MSGLNFKSENSLVGIQDEGYPCMTDEQEKLDRFFWNVDFAKMVVDYLPIINNREALGYARKSVEYDNGLSAVEAAQKFLEERK